MKAKQSAIEEIANDLLRAISASTAIKKDFLSFKETCEYLNVKSTTLYNLVKEGEIPCYKPTGRKPLFKREELFNWVESARIMPIDEYKL